MTDSTYKPQENEGADNSERIERYLTGKMSQPEEQAFLEALRNDKALREEARTISLMIKEMRQQESKQTQQIINDVKASALQQAMTKPRQETHEEAREVKAETPAHRNVFSRLMRSAASIAVLLCLALGGLHYYGVSKTNRLFAQNYSAADLGTTRGGGETVQELITLFNKVGTESGKDLSMTIYQLQQAYAQTTTSYDYGMYAYDIEWYLALGYVKKNELGKARKLLLDAISRSTSDNPYLAREVALYNEIKNLHFL